MDDVTLRLGAEAAQAIDTLAKVQKSLASVVETVQKGSPIYDQFGNVASSSVAKVTDQQEKAKKSTGLLDEAWVRLTGAFTAASLIDRAVGSLISLGQGAVASASRLLDLKDTTGLSVEALQRLEFVEAKTKTEAGALSGAAYQLSLRLAGGTDSVASSAAKLGYTLDELLSMDPESRFYAVADSLAGVGDETTRNNIAVALFGKQWKDIAPAVVAGLRDIGQAAHVSTEEQLRAISTAESTWNEFWQNVKTTATSTLGEIVIAWREADAGFKKNRREDEADQAAMAAQNQSREQADLEKSLGRQRQLAAARQVTTDSYVEQLSRAREKLAALTDEQEANLKAGLALGKSTDDLVEQTKLSADVIELYKEQLSDQTTAGQEAARETAARNEATRNLRSSIADLTRVQIDQIATLLKAGKSEGDIAKAYGYTAQQVRDVADAEKLRADTEKAQIKALEEMRDAARKAEVARQEAAEAEGERTIERATKLYEAYVETGDRLRLAQSSGTTQRLRELDQVELAEIRAAEASYDVTSDLYAELEQQIRDYYQLQRDLANGTAGTIELRMAQQGVKTRADLTKTAADAKRDYEQMRASGLYTAEQLQAKWEEYLAAQRAATGDWRAAWSSALSATAAGFEQISQIAGESMSETARHIGTAVSAADQLFKSTAQVEKGGAANILSGMMGIFGAVATIATIAQAFVTPEWKKVMRDVGQRWGVDISQGLAEEIAENQKDIIADQGFRGGRVPQGARDMARELAELLSLDRIIAEGGGITAANADTWIGRAKPLFDVVREGGTNAAAATKTLVTLIGQFTDQAADTGGRWSAAFKDMLVEALQVGVAVEDVLELLRAEGDRAAESLGGVTGALEENQAALDRTSRIALATFNSLVASGRSPVEAMQMIAGSVDHISATLEKAGLTGNDAYQQLARWRGLVETNAPLLTQLTSANDLMVALANLGGLTTEAFADLQAQGVSTFQQLQAAGFTEQEALTQVAPLLRTIRDLHKEKNLPIEEGTQALIDQAEASGALAKQEASTQQVMREGLSAIIEALGGDIPAAWKTAADAAITAADDIKRDATDQIRSGLGDVEGQLKDGRAWDEWASKAKGRVREVTDEVDHLNFGHSPGGLKEIPLLLGRSQAAGDTWSYNALRHFSLVTAAADRLSLPAGVPTGLGGDGASMPSGFDPAQAAMDPGFGSESATPIVNVYLGTERLDDRIVSVSGGAASAGRLQVPSRAVTQQVSRG